MTVREVELVGGPGDGLTMATNGFVVEVPVADDVGPVSEFEAMYIFTPVLVHRYAPNGKRTRDGRWVFVPTGVYRRS